MATVAQIQRLRMLLQDFFNKRNQQQINSSDYAFQDIEMEALLDNAAIEVTDGAVELADAIGNAAIPLMYLVARSDGLLMIAGDEARRIKWQANNEIVDPTKVAENLVKVASELRLRYDAHRKRLFEEEKAGIDNRPTGSMMNFNDSVTSYSERNFDNRSVRRNSSRDHRM